MSIPLKHSVISLTIITLVAMGNAVAQSSATQEGSTKTNKPQEFLEVTFQSLLSQAETAALNLVIKTVEPRNSMLFERIFAQNCEVTNSFRSTILRFRPDVEITTGDNGSFQSVVAKGTGGLIVSDICDPGFDSDDGFAPPAMHYFPASLGIETTRSFETISLVGEVGWVPFAQIPEPTGFPNFYLGVNPRVGFYLQGGYKFAGQSSNSVGASLDQSAEPANDVILRAKAEIDFEFNDIITFNSLDQELSADFIANATGWYDIAHNTWHHSASATLRFANDLNPNSFFDLTAKSGAGEPTFAKGTQFSAGLTFRY